MSDTPFSPKLANRATDLEASFIREILKLTSREDVISFAGGLPNPAFFPVEAVDRASQRVLQEDGKNVLQYTVTEGYNPLKEYISERYQQKQGIDVSPEEILITNGSQQGLDLVAKLMIDPRDQVILEDPSFIGAIQSFKIFEPEFLPVKLEKDGMDVEQLKSLLDQKQPKLCYTVPNYHNPTGFTYSNEKRQVIGELLAKHQVMLVEDNPYGEINFTGKVYKSFWHHHPEGTLLMGSFSKVISPGMRMGWITAPKEVMEKLVIIKQAADTHSNYLSQRIIYRFLMDNDLDMHVQRITSAYKQQCNTMLSAIDTYFPREVPVSRPEGGMFIWAELPEEHSAVRLFEMAIDHKVAFVPAKAFYPRGDVKNTFRLNFSNASEEQIHEGIKRLGKCLETLLSKN